MTSQPEPTQPEGENPLPPRHRPNLSELGKTTTESELWSLDDDLDTEGPAPDETPRPTGSAIPEPRQRMAPGKPGASAHGGDPSTAPQEQVRMNVSKTPSPPRGDRSPSAMPQAYGDLDDLEMWEEESDQAGIGDLPPVPEVVPEPRPSGPQPPEKPRTQAEPLSHENPTVEEPEYFTAKPTPKAHGKSAASLRPRLGLSGFERIGMVALGVLLLAGAVYFYVFSVKRLPTESLRAETTDFPIEGGRITVESADTYWRIPVTDGPDADTVRRGTRLMPEIEMVVKGHGAVRVLFRDDERQFVGDAVTRAVDGAGTLRIPATAGFEDTGMHAAYRTGGTKPWTAAVYEGESVNSPGDGFKLLFEMNISTNRR